MLGLCAFVSSCKISEKQRREICNTCVTKDSVSFKEVVKLKDTTIYIYQKGNDVYINSPCDSLGNLNFKPIVSESKGIKQTITHIGNVIVSECDVDSLKLIIKGLTETERTYTQKTNEIKYIPCLNEKTKFDGFCFYWFWITCSILLIFVLIKIIKSYLKL